MPTFNNPLRVDVIEGSAGVPLAAAVAALAAAAVAGPVLAVVVSALNALAWLAWTIAITGSIGTAGAVYFLVAGTIAVKRTEREMKEAARTLHRAADRMDRATAVSAVPGRRALPAPSPRIVTGRIVSSQRAGRRHP